MVQAEGDRECRGLLRVPLQLGLFDDAAAAPDLMHRQEAARGLVNVHDAVCADSVLVHEPAVACALTNICFTKLKRFTFFFF